MTLIREINNSIFNMTADAVVIPVNCRGETEPGLQKNFASRYGNREYRARCRWKLVRPGEVFSVPRVPRPGQKQQNPRVLVYFPLKDRPDSPVCPETLRAGVRSLREELRKLGVWSVAIPALGCKEGLPWPQVKETIARGLEGLDLRALVTPPQNPRRPYSRRGKRTKAD